MPATMILTGSESLNRRLAQLKSSKAKQAIRKASREALRPVAAAAIANAPKRTGRLKRSIKVRSLRRSRVRVGMRVTSSGTSNQFKGRTFYGGFIEYGWKVGRRARNSDLGLKRGQRRDAAAKARAAALNNSRRVIRGQQFMKRAARDKRALALRIYESETRQWILRLIR